MLGHVQLGERPAGERPAKRRETPVHGGDDEVAAPFVVLEVGRGFPPAGARGVRWRVRSVD